MVDDELEEQPSFANVVSDETGQLDVRFVLWRKFCAQSGVDVESLPSQLSDEEREAWEELKETELSSTEE